MKNAYTTAGAGFPILFIPYFAESFSLQNVVQEEQEFYLRLGQKRRIIRYDGRGTGLSARDVGDLSHEAMLRDLDAVVKALDLRRFALWGQSLGGPRAIEYAARHGDSDIRLILVATFVHGAEVISRDQIDALRALSTSNWPLAAQLFADMVGREQSDANQRRGRLFRESGTGAVVAAMLDGIYGVDVSALLKDIKGPSLILQRLNDPLFRMDFGRFMASQIPGARLIGLEGDTVMYDPRDVAVIADAVDRFLPETGG